MEEFFLEDDQDYFVLDDESETCNLHVLRDMEPNDETEEYNNLLDVTVVTTHLNPMPSSLLPLQKHF